MKQIDKLIESIEDKYNLSVEELVGYYEQGKNLEWFMQHYNLGMSKIRTILSALNLRTPKKYRVNDLELFKARLHESEVDSVIIESNVMLKEDLKEFESQLVAKEKALLVAKREVSKYRKHLREESIEDKILEVATYTLSQVKPLVFQKSESIDKPITRTTDFLMLSDTHFGEQSTTDELPDSPYDFQVASERVSRVFDARIVKQQSSKVNVLFGGDLLEGVINNAQESAEFPIALTISKVSELLTQKLALLKEHYNEVHVYCVNGNHGRLEQERKSHKKAYDFEYLLHQIIKAHTKEIVDTYEISTNGYALVGNVLLHHGDQHRQASSPSRDRDILERAEEMFGVKPLHIVQGHTHQYSSKIMHNGGYSIVNGATSGVSTYVHTSGILPTPNVQVLFTLGSTGDLTDIHPIKLT